MLAISAIQFAPRVSSRHVSQLAVVEQSQPTTRRLTCSFCLQAYKPQETSGAIPVADMTIENILQMRDAYHAADADGSGELDEDEFVEGLASVWGTDRIEEVRRLFMRIDGDNGGTVGWDELLTFLLVQVPPLPTPLPLAFTPHLQRP